MKLTNRLKSIASLVSQNSIVADIGTDHAYIPIFLVNNGISEKVIASDINQAPLDIAKQHVIEKKLQNYIDIRLGYGLKVVNPYEVDTVIIAGMGGILVKDILEESKDVLDAVETLILQPMMAQDTLRKWLNENNFKIVNEVLSKELDKFYTVIVAKHGYEEIEDEIFFEIGKKLIENKDPLLKEYLTFKINKVNKVLENLKLYDTDKAIKRRTECENKLEKYLELMNYVC